MIKLSKEILIEEFLHLQEEGAKKIKNFQITQNYYLKNSLYGKEYKKFWKNFNDFKKEVIAFKDTVNLKLLKKISNLEENNYLLKKENKKLLKEIISHDYLINLYDKALKTFYNFPSLPSFTPISSNGKVFLLNLSDVHLGEVVEAKYVNFTNEFNKEICVQRLNSIFKQIIEYGKNFKIQELHIVCNGDLLSGNIHNELVRTNDLNEVEALFYLQQYLTKKFIELLSFFSLIKVYFIVGNHSRILPGKPYYKEKISMNYEYLLGKQLYLYFNALQEKENKKRIFIEVADSSFLVKKIKKLKFLFSHGDILMGSGNGGFAGIPFYSICMSGAKLYGILHQIGINESVQFDHILCGHLHTTTKIPLFNGGFCYINGCVIGTNEFSLYKMRSIAKKEQLLLTINDDGICEEINLKF